MKTLRQNLDDVGFINRETDSSGQTIKYRCGRDFIYYALNCYYPDQYNTHTKNATWLEKSHSLGISLPWWLMWTQLQFLYLPRFLSKLKLQLTINGRTIKSFYSLFITLSIPTRSNVHNKIKEIENAVDNGYASGIDISLGLGGLIDHVLFVHGYDVSNFYVFDSHQVSKLEYDKMTNDSRYYMKLPKSIVERRWSKFGRVWILKKIN